LNIDSPVKPLFIHPQGTQIGYNPHTPGRPSLVYHRYFLLNTRLFLSLEVTAGKESASKNALPEMWSLLNKLPRTSDLKGEFATRKKRRDTEA
jgi:hypothetical protein